MEILYIIYFVIFALFIYIFNSKWKEKLKVNLEDKKWIELNEENIWSLLTNSNHIVIDLRDWNFLDESTSNSYKFPQKLKGRSKEFTFTKNELIFELIRLKKEIKNNKFLKYLYLYKVSLEENSFRRDWVITSEVDFIYNKQIIKNNFGL